MKRASVSRGAWLVAAVLSAVVGALASRTQSAEASMMFSCVTPPPEGCHCFPSYCTDWPIGDPCSSTNDC